MDELVTVINSNAKPSSKELAIVLPMYNEEERIVHGVTTLDDYLKHNHLDYCDIILADNNSKDTTKKLALELCEERNLLYHFVKEQGKGNAICKTWLAYEYPFYMFMDIDLATGLDAIPRAMAELRNGYDMVNASRYLPGSEVERSLSRKIVSQSYRHLFQFAFDLDITDPQCGFKSITHEVRDAVIPYLDEFKFACDTQMIVHTLMKGYSIKEIPVSWEEGAGSKVKMRKVIPEFLKGVVKVRREQKLYQMSNI